MREFIICVATGTAVVELSNRSSSVQNQNPVPQIRAITAVTGGARKGKTKRASHKSHKTRKHRK